MTTPNQLELQRRADYKAVAALQTAQQAIVAASSDYTMAYSPHSINLLLEANRAIKIALQAARRT